LFQALSIAKRGVLRQMREGGARHTRCGIPNDDDNAVAQNNLFAAMFSCWGTLGFYFLQSTLKDGCLAAALRCFFSFPIEINEKNKKITERAHFLIKVVTSGAKCTIMITETIGE